MAAHIDYVIALALFLSVFIGVALFTTNYSLGAQNSLETAKLEQKAASLLEITERKTQYENSISGFGVGTYAFRLPITVDSDADLASERSDFSFSEIGFPNADKNSLAIYSDDGKNEAIGNSIEYSVSGDTITFASAIHSGTNKFVAWFDDDSGFASRSTNIGGSDTIPDKLWPVERVMIVQHKALEGLKAKNYGAIKEDFEFRLRLFDKDDNIAFSFGSEPPKQVTVIVAKKPVVFQKSSADVGKGTFIAEVWR